jgi:hypothetical protein
MADSGAPHGLHPVTAIWEDPQRNADIDLLPFSGSQLPQLKKSIDATWAEH